MKISSKTTIEVTIDGKSWLLSKSDAMDLYQQLKTELGILDLPIQPYSPPMQPSIPSNPLPMQPYTIPDYPNYPQIWCQQPSSTCNL